MRELPLDLLACPGCRGPLVASPGVLECRACRLQYQRTAEGADLAPVALDHRAAANPGWGRWREAIRGLDRWRARRRLHPRRSPRQADTPAGRAMQAFFEHAGLHGAVVDVGARDGNKLELMPSGIRYLGLDPFPLENPALPPNACVVRGFVEALPVATGVADAVVALASFDYFVDPAGALGEMDRVLRRDGILAVLISVVTPAVARARSAEGLLPRVGLALAAAPEAGLRGTFDLLADAVTIGDRFNTHYYTREGFLDLLGSRFEVVWLRAVPQTVSTILYVVARKRR